MKASEHLPRVLNTAAPLNTDTFTAIVAAAPPEVLGPGDVRTRLMSGQGIQIEGRAAPPNPTQYQINFAVSATSVEQAQDIAKALVAVLDWWRRANWRPNLEATIAKVEALLPQAAQEQVTLEKQLQQDKEFLQEHFLLGPEDEEIKKGSVGSTKAQRTSLTEQHYLALVDIAALRARLEVAEQLLKKYAADPRQGKQREHLELIQLSAEVDLQAALARRQLLSRLLEADARLRTQYYPIGAGFGLNKAKGEVAALRGRLGAENLMPINVQAEIRPLVPDADGARGGRPFGGPVQPAGAAP